LQRQEVLLLAIYLLEIFALGSLTADFLQGFCNLLMKEGILLVFGVLSVIGLLH